MVFALTHNYSAYPMLREAKKIIDNIEYTETIAFLAEKLAERIQGTNHDHAFKEID